jgi:predicted ATPase
VDGVGGPKGNLPVGTTSFIGRRAELGELAALLSASRLVTLTGVGGVGKTRLALAAAERAADRFRDGVWLVRLSAVADADLLAYTVAAAVRLVDQTTRPPLDVLVDHLADRRLLLILDTCEHLVDACADLVERLLRGAPRLTVLATSRQSLGAVGEQTLRLAPLSLDPPSPAPDGVLEPGQGEDPAALSEAVQLFVARAAAVTPDFAVTAENRAQVARVCDRLEGIPLAIELAAVRTRTLTPQQILDRLEDRFVLLHRPEEGEAAGERGVPDRHQRLLTTVGWSHELCGSDERLAWARLSVFPGAFDVQAARAVCADEWLPADAVHEVLTRLVAKSLLIRNGPAAAPRYRMLDTIREYGARWLTELGQSATAQRRLRDHYLRLARRGEQAWFGPDQAGWFARMTREHENIRAALELSLGEFDDGETALELAGTLWFFWVGAGHLAEGRRFLHRALDAATAPGAGPATTKALWVIGYISVLQGDLPFAISMLIRCRALAKVEGDERAEAYAVHRLGCAALIGDRHARAAALFAEALDRYCALGEVNSNVIMGWVELAMAAAFTGELDRATRLCEQAVALCEEYGERWAKSYALYVLAFIAFTHAEPDRAAELARECLRINHSFHDLIGIVLPIELLALCAGNAGECDHAAVLQGAAGRVWKTIGTPLFGSVYFGAAHLKCLDLAQAALGPDRYQDFYERGLGLGLDEAVACALGTTVNPCITRHDQRKDGARAAD